MNRHLKEVYENASNEEKEWKTLRPIRGNKISKEDPEWGKSGSEKFRVEQELQKQASPQNTEMKEIISGIENMLKNFTAQSKRMSRSEKVLAQNIQKIWVTMTRPNLRIKEIGERK